MMSYSEKPEDITKEEWMDKLNNVHIQRADMNRLIMNYLVTEGFKEAAEKFRMESGIEPNVDLDSLDERIKIREMVLKGQIQEAIALINSLHPELLDTNRYLYFHLQQQHLIELIRLRETEAALEFAQSQLAEQGEESRECLTEMERTLALLAFDNPEESPFGDLLNMMQRQKVWSEVNQAVLDYENRESTPKLAKLLKLLLWAQNELDQKKVKYSRMTDLSKGTIEDPNSKLSCSTQNRRSVSAGLYLDSMAAEQESDHVKPPVDCVITPFKNVCDTSGLKITQINDKTTVWPRSRALTWTLMLLLVTCLLYWSRMAMPICAVTMAKEFGWTKSETGIVLGGHASDRIGGERVLLLSTSSWAVMTAITPLLANIGLQPLVSMTVSRFLLGVLQGVHYPSLVSICAQRVTEGERGLLMSTLACGCYLGMLLVGGVGSLMLDWFGWGSVFYGAGLLALCWSFCVWKCLLHGPGFSLDSLWISSSSAPESPRINWLNLLKEPSVWAMIIAHLCFSSTNYTLMSWLPTFFKDMFPHAKFCAMGVAGVFILLLCKTDSFIQAVACVSLAIGLSTFNNSGVSVNVHDQAPSCAGALFGVMNTCSAFTGSWVNVFSVLALVNVIGVTIFIALGEAKRVDQVDQPQTVSTC
ncbi:hypothetical protein H4Q32_007361 [Labeo rohita]|uniref:CTLH domain-containing protein n=2 Tax=Labeonini TaxID=2743697 RepID=A0ABQ8MGE5_LABRO|nr:hypothetical protein H4Q32_007361 [Labeo rohita]